MSIRLNTSGDYRPRYPKVSDSALADLLIAHMKRKVQENPQNNGFIHRQQELIENNDGVEEEPTD